MALLIASLLWALGVGLVGAFRLPPSYDEGSYAYGGWLWSSYGGDPYQDLVENKPPGIYLVYGVAQRLWGPEPIATRALGLLSLLATGLLVGLLVDAVGLRRAALPAGLATGLVLLYPRFEAHYAFTEPFMVLPAAGMVLVAYWARVRAQPRLLAVAGMLGGLAVLVKQITVLEVAAVALWLLLTPRPGSGRRTSDLAYLLGGCVVPSVGVLIWALSQGFLSEYLQSIVGTQVLITASTAGQRLERLLFLLSSPRAWPLLVLVGGALALLAKRRGRTPADLLATLWLSLALIGPLLGRSYGHQFLQLVPPLVFALSVTSSGLLRHRCIGGPPRLIWAAAVMVFVVLGVLAYSQVPLLRKALHPRAAQEVSDQRDVAAMVAAVARPGDRLLCRHTTLTLHVRTGLPSPTRHAVDYFHDRLWAVQEAEMELASGPPRYVVALADPKVGRLGGLDGGGSPLVRDYLDGLVAVMLLREYRLLETVGPYLVYERKPDAS